MDFDKIKRPGREFNERGAKLAPEDRDAVQNVRDAKNKEESDYAQTRELRIKEEADRLAKKQKNDYDGPKPPDGPRKIVKSDAQTKAEATESVDNIHKQKMAALDAEEKEIYARAARRREDSKEH